MELFQIDRLVDIFLECENRQKIIFSEIPVQANIAQNSSVSNTPTMALPSVPANEFHANESWSMGYFSGSYCGHGRSYRGRLVHLAQRCFYRFDRTFDRPSISSSLMVSPRFSNGSSPILYAQFSDGYSFAIANHNMFISFGLSDASNGFFAGTVVSPTQFVTVLFLMVSKIVISESQLR